jgi:hypothetical protein
MSISASQLLPIRSSHAAQASSGATAAKIVEEPILDGACGLRRVAVGQTIFRGAVPFCNHKTSHNEPSRDPVPTAPSTS